VKFYGAMCAKSLCFLMLQICKLNLLNCGLCAALVNDITIIDKGHNGTGFAWYPNCGRELAATDRVAKKTKLFNHCRPSREINSRGVVRSYRWDYTAVRASTGASMRAVPP